MAELLLVVHLHSLELPAVGSSHNPEKVESRHMDSTPGSQLIHEFVLELPADH